MHVLGSWRDLLVGKGAERVLHHFEIAIEVAWPFSGRQGRQKIRIAVDRKELSRVGEWASGDAPQVFPAKQPAGQFVGCVGHERAG